MSAGLPRAPTYAWTVNGRAWSTMTSGPAVVSHSMMLLFTRQALWAGVGHSLVADRLQRTRLSGHQPSVMEEACLWYRKRMRIETFFSDQKSRGFHLHKSRIRDPQRLARLMIAACFAYIWIIYLGTFCIPGQVGEADPPYRPVRFSPLPAWHGLAGTFLERVLAHPGGLPDYPSVHVGAGASRHDMSRRKGPCHYWHGYRG